MTQTNRPATEADLNELREAVCARLDALEQNSVRQAHLVRDVVGTLEELLLDFESKTEKVVQLKR